MRIADTSLSLDTSSSKLQQRELRMSSRTTFEPPASPVHLSEAGKSAQANETAAIQKPVDAVDLDPMLSLIRQLVSLLTGHEVAVFDPTDWPPQSAPSASTNPTSAVHEQLAGGDARPSVETVGSVSLTEIEQTNFQASGVVRTAEGQEIRFSVSLQMSRRFHQESAIGVTEGGARQKKDPLVVNFNGTSAQLASQRFSFDLDADGRNEQINFVAPGSGFLVLDRNDDGQVNSGLELFGAASGDGFSELSALDADHNGWIDGGDPAFENLRVWTRTPGGEDRLISARQAGIGALSVARVDSPFSLTGRDNSLLGQIRTTGIYLGENGRAGTIQQVDLTV